MLVASLTSIGMKLQTWAGSHEREQDKLEPLRTNWSSHLPSPSVSRTGDLHDKANRITMELQMHLAGNSGKLKEDPGAAGGAVHLGGPEDS